MSKNMTRRRALQAGAALTLVGVPATAVAAKTGVYESLGVKPVINAAGTFTILGGSVMPPEVVAAWVEASKSFVNLSDLQDRVGEKIARLIGVEAALVTTGAAGAMLLGTAAVVTRGDRTLIRRLPDPTGLKDQGPIQKTH